METVTFHSQKLGDPERKCLRRPLGSVGFYTGQIYTSAFKEDTRRLGGGCSVVTEPLPSMPGVPLFNTQRELDRGTRQEPTGLQHHQLINNLKTAQDPSSKLCSAASDCWDRIQQEKKKKRLAWLILGRSRAVNVLTNSTSHHHRQWLWVRVCTRHLNE